MLPPLDKLEMTRMLHAQAQDMELPGSPSGKNGHPQLSQAAREVFGVNSIRELSVDQMRAMWNHMDKTGRLPTKSYLIEGTASHTI